MSEQHIQNVANILESEYLNPFNIAVDKKELYKLSSNAPLKEQVNDILSIRDNGKFLAGEFSEKRIFSKDTILSTNKMKKISFISFLRQ